MVASVVAWLVGTVFAVAGVEKLVHAGRRRAFFAAVREFLPGPLAGVAGAAFLAGELAVLPLLRWAPARGLDLLAALAAAVLAYAVARRLRGIQGECGCGGLWAATTGNLLWRNAVLCLAAAYARVAAPVPLTPGAGVWALGVLAALLAAGGIAEAVRIRLQTR